jgi:hypothetical protein
MPELCSPMAIGAETRINILGASRWLLLGDATPPRRIGQLRPLRRRTNGDVFAAVHESGYGTERT